MDYTIVAKSKGTDYKVSVISPVYNVQDYLAETLTSVQDQTLDDIEIILVDDGSTDNSDQIIRSFLEKNEDITYVKQKNKGPGQARNLGIALAKGSYISFLDSDDLLPLDALETVYTAALEEKADLIIGASLSFNSNRSWFIASHKNNGVYDEGEKDLIRNPELLYSLGPCNKLYKTDLIRTIRFPNNIKVTEDHPFVLEAYLKAKKIYTVDHLIYKYRRREDDDNVSLSQKVLINSLSVLKDIIKSLEASQPLWEQYISNPHAKDATQAFYYNRIVWADIWPALNQALRSKDGSVQKQSLEIINNWISGFSFGFFNQVRSLHQVLTFELVLRFAMLKPETHEIYLKTITNCFRLMDPGSENKLESTRFKKEVLVVKNAYRKQSVSPLKNYVFRSRVRKVYNRTMTIIRNASIRRGFYPIFRLFPIKKKVLLASNKLTDLNDSFAYIYQELKQRRSDYIVKGYFKQSRNFKQLFKYYYDIATARYIILDDYYRPFYNLSFRKGTDVIQVWHAAGAFKKFGFSSIGSGDSNTEEFERRAHGFYTKAVVTGTEIIPKYAEAFRMSEKNIYPLGLPRTDMFFDQAKLAYLKEKYLGQYPQLRNKKIITYAPTFRGGPKERGNFSLLLDIRAMAQALGDEYALILKLHPSVRNRNVIPDDLNQFALNLSSDEMNDVLAITDILISDYSSLVFEFALLNRPMLFYAYDIDQYINERGFYYNYESFVPGPIIKTTDGLIEQIQSNSFDLEKIEDFKRKFFTYLDGESSKRFVETLIEE